MSIAVFAAGVAVGVIGAFTASFVGGLYIARKIDSTDKAIDKAREYPVGSPEWRQCLADGGAAFIPTEEANQALRDAVRESRAECEPGTGLFQSQPGAFAVPYDPAEDPYDPLVNVVALADDLADRSAPARARHAANASLGETHDAVLDYSPEEECADRSRDRAHNQALRRVLTRGDDGTSTIDYA